MIDYPIDAGNQIIDSTQRFVDTSVDAVQHAANSITDDLQYAGRGFVDGTQHLLTGHPHRYSNRYYTRFN